MSFSDYVAEARAEVSYDKLEDATFAGKISSCPGVLAFGTSLRQCVEELRSTLEDWMLVGLRLGHPLPGPARIDLIGSLPAQIGDAFAETIFHSTELKLPQ